MDYNLQIAMTIRLNTGDPETVARALGVEATVIAYKGQRDPVRVLPRSNYVSYRSNAADWNSDLAEHWADFYGNFRGKSELLSDLARDAKIIITIIVDHEGRFPSILLTHEMLRFAVEAGAVIDIDVYENLEREEA